MLTIKQIKEDKEAVVRKLAKKGFDAAAIIDEVLALDYVDLVKSVGT